MDLCAEGSAYGPAGPTPRKVSFMDVFTARALLGVSSSADAEQIKRAFRAKAREAHPDRGGTPAAFRRLVEAQNAALAGVPAEVRPASVWLTESTIVAEGSFVAIDVAPRRAERSGIRLSEAASSNRSFGEVLAREIAAA